MPNYSVRNCLNENETLIVSFNKGSLNTNDAVLSYDGMTYNCYSVIGEVLQDPQQPVNGVYPNCLECYKLAGFYFTFINCKIRESPTYYISSNDFKVLPVLNKIYYMSIDGGNNLCYQFVGLVESGPISRITGEIVEYNQCGDCVVKPTFSELYQERINDPNYTQKTNDFKDNYSNFINEREGQEPKR